MNCRHLLSLSAGLFLPGIAAFAQQGVSPSSSARWMDEWQNRRSPEAAEVERSPGRVGDPQFMSMSLSGALRMQADLTGYHSQFQQARRFPAAVDAAVAHAPASGRPLSATLDQAFEWNRIEFAGARQEAMFSTTELSLSMQHGTLDSGLLTLDAAGGVTLASSDDFLLSSGGGTAWFMQPGSSLVFERRLGDVTLSFYERFAARPDAALSFFGQLQGSLYAPFFAAMQNDLGAVLAWQPRQDLELSLNYNRASSQALRSPGDSFGFNPHGDLDVLANRDIHSLLATLTWRASRVVSTGLRAGHAWTSYEESFSNDGRQWHAGLFADLRLPLRHRLHLEVGTQGMSFDEPRPVDVFWVPFPLIPATPAAFLSNHGDSTDLDASPYASFSLGGPLGERLSHQLTGGREAALGLLSNYVEARYVNYEVQARLWAGAAMNLSAFYEDLKDSASLFAADTLVRGGSLMLQQKWRRFTFSAGCGLTRFDVDAQDSSWVLFFGSTRQLVFQTGVSCQICPGASLNLAWMHLVSDANFTTEDQVQDRLSLGLGLRF